MKISPFCSLLLLFATSCAAQDGTPKTLATADTPPVTASAASTTPITAPPAAPIVKAPPTPLGAPGTARIARWHDDQKAVFLLMFDDGWPSHWQVAVPELVKRHMIATFYIVSTKGEFTKFIDKWKTDVLGAGMVLGNHTATHNGFQGAEDTEKEIGDCTRFLLDFVPGKNPRLISFALPGVKDYDYGPGNTLAAMLAKYNLIDRGDFKGHGANYHQKTTEEMLALADSAIASGGMNYLVIHGVERITPNWHYQDFWALKQDIFLPLLDGLAERRDRGDLWITDHISEYKYATERDAGKLETLENTPKKIRLSLKSSTDPQLYDEPLTVLLQVPPSWKNCQVEQGTAKMNHAPVNGVLQFDALPGDEAIVVSPVK